MRIPQQVTERVKEAPAQALRAVFSGIGQVLLVADRIKSRAAEPTRAQPGPTERRGESGQKVAAGPKDETRWRSLDETGNVRLLSEEDAPEPAASAEATADTAQNANTLSDVIKLLINIAQMQTGTDPTAAALVKSVTVTPVDKVVTVTANLPQDVFQQMLQSGAKPAVHRVPAHKK